VTTMRSAIVAPPVEKTYRRRSELFTLPARFCERRRNRLQIMIGDMRSSRLAMPFDSAYIA
jgi:hypothetical protein